MKFIVSTLFVLLLAGCIKSVPKPPVTALPVTSYDTIFTAETAKIYSETTSDPYPPFKMSYSIFNGQTVIVKDEQVTRQYIKIGKLVFTKNWYDDETIVKLIRIHVPQKGGDAVLSYHMRQESAAVMKDQITGKSRNLYYGTISLEIIRYIDK